MAHDPRRAGTDALMASFWAMHEGVSQTGHTFRGVGDDRDASVQISEGDFAHLGRPRLLVVRVWPGQDDGSELEVTI